MDRGYTELLDAACYTLRRVQTDPDFRHHMLMTETMDRLCRAVAVATDRAPEDLLSECSIDKQPDYRKLEPQLIVAKRRVGVLERVQRKLAAEAGLTWEQLEAMEREAHQEEAP